MRKRRLLSKLLGQGGILWGKKKSTSYNIYPLIEDVMEKKRPYLKEDFLLEDLCRMVGYNRTYISRSLSEHNTSFSKLVREMRVRHLKELLEENTPRKYDMDDLVAMTGFSSKRVMCAALRHFYPDVYALLRLTRKRAKKSK